MTLFLNLVSQLIAAILCAAAGFIIWDIGTRSPIRLLIDLLSAARSRQNLISGVTRFLIGLAFVGVSIGLIYFAIPPSEAPRYTVYQIGAFVCALAIELLIGEDVRALLASHERSK